jgi:lipopolysaccharide transport system permease protein
MSWALSSLGVYLRDVSQIVSIFTTVLMFLSPIFYPISVLPEFYQKLLYLNPLMPAIEQARGILFFGEGLNWMLMGGYYAAMLGVAWAGFAWFQKTRKGFADVI